MVVAEDTHVAGGAPVPVQRGPRPAGGEQRPSPFTLGNVLRVLVFGALAAFLLYYVGPRNIAETLIKVLFAVALTAALWIGANLLFDQAYAHWTRFNALLGAACGFVGYFVAEANDLFKSLLDEPAASPGKVSSTTSPAGGRADRLQRPALGADRRWRVGRRDVPPQCAAKADRSLPAGGARVHRLRCAHGLRLRRLGMARSRMVEAVDLHRRRRCPRRHHRAVAVRTRRGPAVGGHGCRRRVVRRRMGRSRPRCRNRSAKCCWPLSYRQRSSASASGSLREPDAQKRRRIDRRSRSWIFVTPALALIVVGLVAPLVRTIYLSFRDRKGTHRSASRTTTTSSPTRTR